MEIPPFTGQEPIFQGGKEALRYLLITEGEEDWEFFTCSRAQIISKAFKRHADTGAYTIAKTAFFFKTVADFPPGIERQIQESKKETPKEKIIRSFNLDRAWTKDAVKRPFNRFYGLYSGGIKGHPFYKLGILKDEGQGS